MTSHNFLLPADDDASDTASQRSISLSSPRHSLTTPNHRISQPDSLDFAETPNTSAPSSVFEEKNEPNPPPLATYPPTANSSRSTDALSIASFASSSSQQRKARPESMIVPPPRDGKLVLGIALVDFNHLVGPRVEYSKGDIFQDEEVTKILPFLALPDGAHLSAEDYSYFHLVPSGPNPSTVFGISCNQQIAASALLVKSPDVTRSTVQKAVVVLASKPLFGPIRDKLGVVTTALFQQRDFSETSILDDFGSALEPSLRGQLTESGLYMGTNLRELVQTFRQRTLILVKALILQKRILFYGHPVERLCTYQYSLVSLLPGLLQTLDDSGSPPLAARAPTLSRPTSLKTSERKSMLAYLGLPLDVFGKDAFFQPYLPLQQLDMLKATPSWLCGTTNSIVSSQNNSRFDFLVNTQTAHVDFANDAERAVSLTAADRKWMDDIVRDVNEAIEGEFKGSEDWIRSKFEDYIQAFLAAVRYQEYMAGKSDTNLAGEGVVGETNSWEDFNPMWIAEFKKTGAYGVWDRVTDSMIFDIVEPRHPCTDKPTVVSDIGLRLQEGIQDLKLDQQLEAVTRTINAGSAGFFKAVEGVKGRWQLRQQTPSKELPSTPPPPPPASEKQATATITKHVSLEPASPAPQQKGWGSFWGARTPRLSVPVFGKFADTPQVDPKDATSDKELPSVDLTGTLVPPQTPSLPTRKETPSPPTVARKDGTPPISSSSAARTSPPVPPLRPTGLRTFSLKPSLPLSTSRSPSPALPQQPPKSPVTPRPLTMGSVDRSPSPVPIPTRSLPGTSIPFSRSPTSSSFSTSSSMKPLRSPTSYSSESPRSIPPSLSRSSTPRSGTGSSSLSPPTSPNDPTSLANVPLTPTVPLVSSPVEETAPWSRDRDQKSKKGDSSDNEDGSSVPSVGMAL